MHFVHTSFSCLDSKSSLEWRNN